MRRVVGLLASVVVALVAAYGLLVVGPVGTRGGPARAQAAEQQLDTRQGLYPRVIRLEHSGPANGRIIASVSASSTGGVTDIARIYESTDAGTSFHQIGEVHDPQADGGHTWTYLSSCAVAAETTPIDQGMWEPEFSVDSRGYLDCYFSDETQAGFSQVLAAVTSTDGGVTWGSRRNVVATASGDRPGMANVRRLPSGTYFMSYELCGQRADACRVYYRTSADGWNWGDPGNPGTVAATPDGRYLYRTPTIAWTPAGGPRGRILLIGGLVKNAQGQIMPASGSTIFVNTENGFGHWFEVPAPVTVSFSASPDQQELVCNNYSPSLLPSADGTGVLQLATKRRADGSCGAFFASGPTTGTGTASGVVSGATYRLRNVQSGVCLDVAKGSTASGANVQQWTCNQLAPQIWRLEAR